MQDMNSSTVAELELAIEHHQAGRLQEAGALYQQILHAEPNHPDVQHLLGLLAHQVGKNELAIELITNAIAVNPTNPDYFSDLGSACHALGKVDEAILCFHEALKLDPHYALAHNNLGTALRAQGKLADAISSFEQALAVQPDLEVARINLDAANAVLNRSESAVPIHGTQSAHDKAAALFAEFLKFGAQFETPLKPHWRPHRNTPDANKRLKIGYVSADFRDHAIAFFIEPILAHHDTSQVEIFCYYNHTQQDNVTSRIMEKADHWIGCKNMSDDELASKIRSDGIDVLVDLSNHTAGNRLLTFARKPAPVQAAWLGAPSTTGLSAMDYRLTDEYLDPPELSDQYHTEKLVRLKKGAAYAPPKDSPAVNDLPALSSPQFTFACLNNLAKINGEVIFVWSRVLSRMPHAKLMLANAGDPTVRNRLIATFSQYGIDQERLILQPKMPLTNFLALHHQIDVAFDPFPYNGDTTTRHSLWMGVPVITLQRMTSVSRVGSAIMKHVGLPEFAVTTKDEYVETALRIAQDLPALNRIRHGLREKIASTMGHDPLEITRDIENAFRGMWRTWCQQHQNGAV